MSLDCSHARGRGHRERAQLALFTCGSAAGIVEKMKATSPRSPRVSLVRCPCRAVQQIDTAMVLKLRRPMSMVPVPEEA